MSASINHSDLAGGALLNSSRDNPKASPQTPANHKLSNVKICYNPATDKLFKRYKCSNPACQNYEAKIYLDKVGLCSECQVKQARATYMQEAL